MTEAKWHRREERARLKGEGTEYVARNHREHSSPWMMEKDGKTYWGSEAGAKEMRK